MSRLIPPKPPASASPSVLRMFRLLRKLPDDFTVWHRVASRDGPQFLILWRERHAFLLQVADTTQQLADTALQPSLFEEPASLTPDALGREERGTLESFLTKPLPADLALRRLVVFPNVAEATIDQVELLRSGDSGVAFLGLHQTPEDHFARRLEALAEAPLPVPALVALRRHFTPEAVIAETSARLPLLRRQASEPLPPSFLDLDQETLTKLDVELPPEAGRAALAAETRLVSGPAGCGKSLVLLHRALLAANLHRGARVLILTHNRPIRAELRRRAVSTAPAGHRIQWLTFFEWARRHLEYRGTRILHPALTEARLAEIAARTPGLWGMSPRFLTEELGYLRDLGVGSEQEYLALDREGRLAGLSGEKRGEIWRLLEEYRESLRKNRESDWHECALDFRRLALEHTEQIRHHDFIFIDEAQFFAKVWFAPVLAALAPGGQLFLAADSTQGFLKRRQSWLAAGIDVRGRSTRLAVPYRSTRAILTFASRWLVLRRTAHPTMPMDDLDPPSEQDLALVAETGEAPFVMQTASPQEALATMVREVAALRQSTPWLAGKVLVLHADSTATRTAVSSLRSALGEEAVIDLNAPRTRTGRLGFCSVSNLHAATGLEAAVVFLLGIDRLLAREADPRLDAPARAELAADHTRLLYMAFTRAASRLVVLTCEEPAWNLLSRLA